MTEPTFDVTLVNRTDGSERVIPISHEQLRAMSAGETIHLLPSPTAYYESIRILAVSPTCDRIEYETVRSTQVWQCQRCGAAYKATADGPPNPTVVPERCSKILEDGEPCGGKMLRFGDAAE